MSAADWQVCTDPATSHTYYYNAKTRVTTWDMPPELRAAAQPAAPAPAPAPAQPAAAASGWVRHYDANSKNYYYFNAATKQTSWTDPTTASSTTVVPVPAVTAAVTATQAAPVAAATAAPAAVTVASPATPARIHKLPPPLPPTPKQAAALAAAPTPATPVAQPQVVAPAATPTVAAAAAAAPTANDLFDRFMDSTHNTYYYVNKQTKASQWEMPAGWVDPSELSARRLSASKAQTLKLQPTGSATPGPSLSLSMKTKPASGFNSLPGALNPMQLQAAAAAGGFASPQPQTPVSVNTPYTPYTPVQAPLSQGGAHTGSTLAPLYGGGGGGSHTVTPPGSTPSTPGPYTQAPMSNPTRSATMMSINSNSSIGGGAAAAAAGAGSGVVLPHAAQNALASLGGLTGLSGSAKAALAVFKPAKLDDNVVRFDSAAGGSQSTKHGRSQSVMVGSSPGSATLPANFTMPVATASVPQIDAKTGRPMGLPAPLRGDIAKFALDGFAKEHFRSAKKAPTKKSIPVEQELSWQKEPIKKSLLAAAKNYDSACVKLFGSIQAFMLETGKRNAMQLLDAIVTQGVQKAPLRDEIFCQITKQTRNNPNALGCAEGWKLFAICVSAFAPTREFQNYLVNYFIDNYDSPVDDVRVLAPYCYFRLHKTLKDGPEPLKLAEVDAFVKAGGPRSATVTWGGNVSYIVSLQKQEGLALDVPLIMYSLIDTIRKLNGLNTKGIFRLAAEGQLVKNHVAQCKAATGLTGTAAYEMKHADVHVAADTLKIWLRELAEPLLPIHLYDSCIKAAENPAAVAHIIATLPKPQFDTLDFLLNFLCELAFNEAATAMGPENIAVVFSPNLLRTTDVDPAFLFRNEGKVRAFVKNAVVYWMKNRPVAYAGPGAAPTTPPAAAGAPGTPAARK